MLLLSRFNFPVCIGVKNVDGGLKMIIIKEFDKSLKLTWLRKLFATSPDWEDFSQKYKVDGLVFTATLYHDILEQKPNLFWRDVSETHHE